MKQQREPWRCLMIVTPGHGFLNSTLALAQRLQADGLAVVCAVTPPYRHFFDQMGVQTVPYRTVLPPGVFGPLDLMQEAFSLYAQISEAWRHLKPDVVAYTFLAYAGRLLARRFDVPAVQLWQSHPVTPQVAQAPEIGEFNPLAPETGAHVTRARQMLDAHGFGDEAASVGNGTYLDERVEQALAKETSDAPLSLGSPLELMNARLALEPSIAHIRGWTRGRSGGLRVQQNISTIGSTTAGLFAPSLARCPGWSPARRPS